MTETIDTIDGKEVHDTHTCAFTGKTIYTVKDDDGTHYVDIDKNGDELTAWELSGPTDNEHGAIVQTDPDGNQRLTETGRQRLIDIADTLYGVLPDGTIVAALTHGSLIAEHYNDQYEAYHKTPLCKPMKRLVGPGDMWIDEYSYQTGSGIVDHTSGPMERVSPDLPTRSSFKGKYINAIQDHEYAIPAPVIYSGTTLWTHENYVTALEDRIEAAYSIEQ